MKRLLILAFAALLAFVSRAEAEKDVLWLYWTVDASVDQSGRGDGIEFYGANLYVVEEAGGEGRLISTKYVNGSAKALNGANEDEPFADRTCDCLMSDISGVGVGAQFYVELLGADYETVVGYWQDGYMTMEELTRMHQALTGMVAGLQREEPFHHVHGGEWVANQFSSVPEPSSGLLLLIGTAILALRRRKL